MPESSASPAASNNPATRLDAIILAAGQGKRMGSDLPKVLFPVQDKPMVRWVVEACLGAGVQRCIVVVGHKGHLVREALAEVPQCQFVEQARQLGTGDAARSAAGLFDPSKPQDVLVLAGDMPLVRPSLLEKLVAVHRQTGAAASMATAVLEDPTGYGRILRDEQGRFRAIVEQKDATPEQLAVREVNPSYYCFRSDLLFESLERIENRNKQGEFYLTDVPGLLTAAGHTVTLLDEVPPEDIYGVNTPGDLAHVDGLMRARGQ